MSGVMAGVLIRAVGVIAAYLLGSIPVGLLVVRALKGQDIRSIGSGRTGGTNAFRAGGLVAGAMTAIGDAAKGIGAVNIARLLLPGDPILEALCAVAAVAGHNWPIYIGFRGGAGTGPNIGAAIALWPLSAAILIPLTPILLFATGYASVTSTLISLVIVALFVVRVLAAGQPAAYAGYALATTVLVAVALIPNYRRLIAGTERMVGPRARATQSSE